VALQFCLLAALTGRLALMIKFAAMGQHRKLFTIALSILLFVACLYWLFLKWQFDGDGALRYLGPFEPSYRISMARVPLNQPGEYRYSFARLPAVEDMNFQLKVVGEGGGGLRKLEELKTRIDVNLTNGAGKGVCSVSGSLRPSENGAKWVILSDGYSVIYSVDCLHFSTRPRTSYILLIRVNDVDPDSPNALITPMLEGSGIKYELP
jgi:hypothetical protein